MTTIPGYFSITDAAAHLEMSQTGVRNAAKEQEWVPEQVGRSILFAAADIYEYRDLRHRTALAKKLGWGGKGLCRMEDVDIECPFYECTAFTIEWPAPPYQPEKYLCLEGHEGVMK